MEVADGLWHAVWADVAARLRRERVAGQSHLLTEDVLRYQTVLALEAVGVGPARLLAEYRAPELAGGKVDLMIDAPSGAAVEFKFPRDSSTGFSPDPMTFGEMLRDVVRLTLLPAGDRWVVQVLNPRLVRYIRNASGRAAMTWMNAVGDVFQLDQLTLEALPPTAVRALGGLLLTEPVTVRCRHSEAIDDGLSLFAYRLDANPVPTAVLAAPPATVASPAAALARSTRDGARREILAAVRAIMSHTGRHDVAIPEVIEEMHRRGTGYADSTIRTMMTSHLCAEASGPGVAGYDDLTRAERGRYRLRLPGT